MDEKNLDLYRNVFRNFNFTLGIYRNPVYPGLPLSYAELAILLMLYENPLAKIEDLAAFLRVNKSSISRKLKTLEKHKLIVRKTVPGKSRKLSYTLTEDAQHHMNATRDRSRSFLELMHTYMGQEKFTKFFDLMQSATEAISRIHKEHSDVY